MPAPDVPGTFHTMVVAGLQEGTKYYFAIKSEDFAGNVSVLSNVPFGTTLAPPPTSNKGGAASVERDRYANCGAGAASSSTAMILLAALVALAAATRAFKMH